MARRRNLLKGIAGAAAFACIMPVASFPARAEDLSSQLGEVRRRIEEKDFTTALEDLKFIAQQIQELRAAEVRHLFPPPPPGWKAEPPVRTSREETLWSRRLEVRRRYVPESGDGRIEVVFDFFSPLIPTVTLSLNPVYVAGDSRMELVEFGSWPGLLQFNPDTGEGELVLILDGRILVTLRGRGIPTRSTLRDYAARLDYHALEATFPP